MENLELAAKEVGGLRLPPGLEPLEVAGKGSRSITFRANYRGSILAMKVYRPDVIDNYRKKYDLNIAVFEMSRNRAFRKIPELLPFAAKPISVMGHDGRCSLLFLQEFIEAVPLKELAEKDKGLPDSVLEAGATIVRVAEQNGLHDLDFTTRMYCSENSPTFGCRSCMTSTWCRNTNTRQIPSWRWLSNPECAKNHSGTTVTWNNGAATRNAAPGNSD